MHAKLRSALTRIGGAGAIVMQSIAGEELAQGPYVAAGGGFERASLRTQSTELNITTHDESLEMITECYV